MPPRIDTTPRFRLTRQYTASKWSTVLDAVWTDALKRGRQVTEDGTISPPLTNQEAVALISGTRALAAMTSDGFPLWAQYAAVAYDWDARRDRFATSVRQMGLMYPADIGVGLWSEVMHVFNQLEAERQDVPARLDINRDTFQTLAFVQDMARDLKQDGARASAKQPFPACRDKKTGKLRFPRPPCAKDGKGPIIGINPRDGSPIRAPCDKPGDCETVTVDPIRDPITAVGKSLLPLVVGGLFVWWLISPNPRRRRRS
jgi:hypothetical protein